VSSCVPSGSRSWRSPPSTLLRVPPMEVDRFKHRQLAPTVGPSSRSSANSKDLSSQSIYSVQYDSGAISIRSYIEFEAARRFKSKPRRIHLLLAQDSTGPAELFPCLFLCEFQSETGNVMQAPAIHLHLMVRFQGKIQFFFNSDSKLLSCQCFEFEREQCSVHALRRHGHPLLLQCGT
jgi:hypothetical protein